MRNLLPLLLSILFLSSPALYAAKQPNTLMPGQVLIKLKPSFAYLNADGKNMRSQHWKTLIPGLSVDAASPVAAAAGVRTKASQRTTQASGIDLRLYHQLSFDPGLSVEQALEQLYKSGIVEVAEPVYAPVSLGFTANDPQVGSQYYLNLIKAYDAWNVSQSCENVVIAVLDTGVDLAHPDLAANIFKNESDPIDGVDNDADGYIDNYQGWDFAGSNYNALVGDNDPSTTQSNARHGSKVAGIAAAVLNNGVGIAGVSFNAKIMPLKHMADNDTRANGSGYLLNIIKGVLYAASHGAHIINASYGSGFYSQIEQDIYKLVALEYNVLVVAAAGNSNNSAANYPSDYTHVLSVAASTWDDKKANISSFGYGVDLTAPGERIFSTTVNSGYENGTGTSFAAPVVAGAAALVKTKYPNFSAVQLGELLRISADPAFLTGLSTAHKGKMGNGRLDIARALGYRGPAIRAENAQLTATAAINELKLTADFKNHLWSTNSDLTVTLVSLSENVTILEPTVVMGVMQADAQISNSAKPFKILVHEDTPDDFIGLFRLEFSSEGYTDRQYVKIILNPSYIHVNENKVGTTIAGNGRIGYSDNRHELGQGLIFNGKSLLYEMGIVMAAGNGKVVNNVRSANGVDDDFVSRAKIRKSLPGTIADTEVWGSFNDSGDSLNRLQIEANYRMYSWQQAPHDQSIVMVYTLKNTGTDTLQNYYFGLYADWDISTGNYKDRAGWDSVTNTGYVYASDPAQRNIVGIQALSGKATYWALDNDHNVPNNPFGVYDGFTDEEKYKALSSGIGRENAGLAAQGSDVSHTLGSGPYTIAAGDSVVVAFALHAGTTLAELKAAASNMQTQYDRLLVVQDKDKDPTPDSNDEGDNGEEEEEEEGEVTGIDENEIGGLLLYPNPAQGEIMLSLSPANRADVRVRIIDPQGRLLSSTVYAYDDKAIRVRLPHTVGLYLLEIYQGKKRSLARVLVQ